METNQHDLRADSLTVVQSGDSRWSILAQTESGEHVELRFDIDGIDRLNSELFFNMPINRHAAYGDSSHTSFPSNSDDTDPDDEPLPRGHTQ